MRTRLLAVLGLLGAVLVLSLSGCGGTPQSKNIFGNISMNLDSSVDCNAIHVNVHTAPAVNVNRPFTVTASISSQDPLTSLTGNAYDLGQTSPNHQAERLDEILRPPPSYTGSYALCLIVQLRLDATSAFEVDTTLEREFTLVPDVTTAQTAQWTVLPRDTFGLETVPHEATVGVWFDAEPTCRLGTPSLLDDWFYLVSSSHNVVLPATFTVVNEDLRQQRAITAHLQPIAMAAVPVVTIASVGWAAGFFEWLLGRRRARRKQGASEKVTHRSVATRSWFSVMAPGAALLTIGMLLITLGPSAVVYDLGTDAALVSFFGGLVVAFVGIVFLARGVRRIRSAYSA